MAAVIAMSEPELDEAPALDWRELDDFLKYWGRARWRVGLCGGFPEQSAIVGRVELYEPREWFQVKQLTAQGKQTPYFGGHRILYDAAWSPSVLLMAVNMAINSLPEPQFKAVVVKYAIGYVYEKEFSSKEQADMLEISTAALTERLRRARKSLGRALVNFSRQGLHKRRGKVYINSTSKNSL